MKKKQPTSRAASGRNRGTPGREVVQAERQTAALALRRKGLRYDQIAQELGLRNRTLAWRLVQQGLQAMLREPAEAVLQLELERLDELQVAFWEKALRSDPQAFACVERIMNRRAKLLGLDGPVKVAATDPTGTEDRSPGWQLSTVEEQQAFLAKLAQVAREAEGMHAVLRQDQAAGGMGTERSRP